MQENPGLEVVELYKETEELRSGFVIASIAGQGPDLVYGPSDPVGIYEATRTIQPLEGFLSAEYLSEFDSSGVLYYNDHLYMVADKIGNHIAVAYNKKYVPVPPRTDRELIEMSKSIQDQYGYTATRPNVYGLAWNYTEPFFFIPFLTGFGGWVFEEDGRTPSLDTPEMIRALNYVQDLRDLHEIIPNEADYEIADALFKDGKTAMLINGDWSWSGYAEKGIDLGVAPLPLITETGLWPAPMISPKGYSVNANTGGPRLDKALALLRYLLSEDNQLETARALSTAPTRSALYDHPDLKADEILQNSLLQIRRGRLMPVVPEMRAVWDAMRPGYQAVLGGARTPEDAAHDMQQLAQRRIRDMNE
jgi:maltose-binding protein MalE